MIENEKTNAFEIDEIEKGILILQHQIDDANTASFGSCELELSLLLPYATIETMIKKQTFTSYAAFKSWMEKLLVENQSIYPLRDYVAAHKLKYEFNLVPGLVFNESV